MLTDFYLISSPTLKETITDSKNKFTENSPFILVDSGLGQNKQIVVFHDHFIDTLILVLTDGTGLTISQMSTGERRWYYHYIDYLNKKTAGVSDMEMSDRNLHILSKLDQGVFDMILNKPKPFIKQEDLNKAFNTQ